MAPMKVEWKSTKTSLPVDSDVVLFVVPTDGDLQLGYRDEDGEWYSIRTDSGDDSIYSDDQVTHWVELPDPPEDMKTDG